MIPPVEVLKNYHLDDTTKSIWGISRSYANIFLDTEVLCVVDLDDSSSLADPELIARAVEYLQVIEKMLQQWQRIRITERVQQDLLSYRDRLLTLVEDGNRPLTTGDGWGSPETLFQSMDRIAAALEGRVCSPGDSPGERSLAAHVREIASLLDHRIGIVKSGDDSRERMLDQVSLMFALTLTRKGECAVLAGDQGFEGLITIPYRNMLAREIEEPDSPLNVLRGSRVTAILPDEHGKFRRNFVSSWVSPNERVFVTALGVEDQEARSSIVELVRSIGGDLAGLGFSGEKYRLDIGTDRDALEEMFEELMARMPGDDDDQVPPSLENLVPVWEKIAQICGVLCFHTKRDEALRHMGSTRGRRFAIEIERLKSRMDEISGNSQWFSDPVKLEQFQQAQKEMMSLLEHRQRR